MIFHLFKSLLNHPVLTNKILTIGLTSKWIFHKFSTKNRRVWLQLIWTFSKWWAWAFLLHQKNNKRNLFNLHKRINLSQFCKNLNSPRFQATFKSQNKKTLTKSYWKRCRMKTLSLLLLFLLLKHPQDKITQIHFHNLKNLSSKNKPAIQTKKIQINLKLSVVHKIKSLKNKSPPTQTMIQINYPIKLWLNHKKTTLRQVLKMNL